MKAIRKKIYIAISFVVCVSFLAAQSIPTTLRLEKNVSALTGDLNLQIPAFALEEYDGKGYPLIVTYNAAQQVDQNAGWIGLGFNLQDGQISRKLIGQPDDFKNQTITKKTYKATSSDADYLYNISTGEVVTSPSRTVSTKYYGPIYFKDYPTTIPTPTTDENINMDVIVDVDKDAQVTTLPGYDEYYINTAAIAGKMNLGSFSLGSIVPSVANNNSDVTYKKVYNSSQRPEFICDDEFIDAQVTNTELAGGLVAKSFMRSSIDYDVDDVVMPEHEDFYRLKTISNNSIHNDNCNGSNERLCTKKYVEYFTNSQLDDVNISSLPGFMEYTEPDGSKIERPSGTHPADAIGAIRITDETGMVYHFSLPVYVLKEESYDFHLDADYKIGTTTNDSLVITTNENKYAISWKLTAITGPDYVDVNGNAYPDEADKGYWIRFDYSKWGEVEDRFPAYGLSYNADYNSENSSDCVYCRTDFESYSYAVSNYNRGFYSVKSQEVYYLEKVMTSTQSLYFFKEIRKDVGKSKVSGSSDLFPMLALKRIALIENKHNPESLLSTSTSSMPKHGFTAPISYANAMFNYQFDNSSSFKDKCLSVVEFNYDYSLCNRYFGNIATTVADNDVDEFIKQSSIDYAYAHSTEADVNNASQSGKLTLKSIQTYDYHNTRNQNATEFEYAYNPDYPYYVSMRDFWGYYKSDGTQKDHPSARYTTVTSGGNTDAWSLTKIKLPTKAELLIEYESDRHEVDGLVVRGEEDDIPYLYTNYSKTSAIVEEVAPVQTNIGAPFDEDLSNVFQHTDPFTLIKLDEVMGGGLRVSKISLKEGQGETSKTYSLKYTYNHGVATNLPYKYAMRLNYASNPNWNALNDVTANNPGQMGTVFKYLVPRSTFNTGYNTYVDPMVGYEEVKVTVLDFDGTDGDLGYKKYTFYNDWKSFGVYKAIEGMLLYTVDNYFVAGKTCAPLVYPKFVHSVNYANFSDRYGKLKKTELYDKYDNLISSTKYLYETRKIHDVYHVGFNAVGEKSYKYYVTFVNLIVPSDIPHNTLGVFTSGANIASEAQQYKMHISAALGKASTVLGLIQSPPANMSFSKINTPLSDATMALSAALGTSCPCTGPGLSGSTAYSYTQSAIATLNGINSSNYLTKSTEVNTVVNNLQTIMASCFVGVDAIPTGVTNYQSNYNLLNVSGQMIIPSCNNGNVTISHYASYNIMSRDYSRLAAVYTIENGTIRTDSTIYDAYGLVAKNISITGSDISTKDFSYAYSTHNALDLKARNSANNNRVSLAKSATAHPGFSEQMDYVSQYPRVVWNNGYQTETANLWTLSKTYSRGLLNGGISLYNSNNKPVESYDALNRFTSQKYGYSDKYIISSASNSTYSESMHTSFEDDILTGTTKYSVGGEVYLTTPSNVINESTVASLKAHSGTKVLRIEANSTGAKYLTTVSPDFKPNGTSNNYGKLVENKDYAVYVWVSKLTSSSDLKLKVSLSSGGGSPTVIVNGGSTIIETPTWKLVKAVFNIPTQSSNKDVTIEVNNTGSSNDIYVDDLRIQPVSATLQAYVYDEFTGLVLYSLGENNMYIRKEYDNAGRVIKEFVETKDGEKLLKEMEYNTPLD